MNDQQIDEAFIKAIIESEAEESVHMDFKRGDSLYFKEGKTDRREELAKDIAAFANSDGGLLIYGIEEREHKASVLTYVDESMISKIAIEEVLKHRISKNIEGIEIHYIRVENDPTQLVVVFRIPRSSDAPHMVGNKFYKRFQTLSAPMEEYEVRDSYFRTAKPTLELDFQTEYSNGDGELRIVVRNTSSAISYDYKLNIAIPKTFMAAIYESQRRKLSEFYINGRDPYYYSIPNRSPLFPNEENAFVQLMLNKVAHSVLLDPKTKFEAVLYYDGGFEQRDFFFMDEKRDTKMKSQ